MLLAGQSRMSSESEVLILILSNYIKCCCRLPANIMTGYVLMIQ